MIPDHLPYSDSEVLNYDEKGDKEILYTDDELFDFNKDISSKKQKAGKNKKQRTRKKIKNKKNKKQKKYKSKKI